MRESTKPSAAYTTRNPGLKSFQDFQNDLENAVSNSLPSATRPYRQVAVLAFHWEHDMVMKDRQSDLLEVFRGVYGFHVESFEIPCRENHYRNGLFGKLCQFSRDWIAKDTLCIYISCGYSTGISTPSYVYAEIDLLVCKALAETSAPQGKTTEDLSDILYITNMWGAGTEDLSNKPELLAANTVSGLDYPAESFIQTLATKLREFDGNARTVAQLYAAMFRETRDNGLETLPFHCSKKGGNSITLARLPFPNVSNVRDNRGISGLSHRVLLSIEVKDEVFVPTVQEWFRRLNAQLPPETLLCDIAVQSVFRGVTVIFLTAPLEIWTLLPDNVESYKFIAHVGQGSFPFTGPKPSSSVLPLRPAPVDQSDSLFFF